MSSRVARDFPPRARLARWRVRWSGMLAAAALVAACRDEPSHATGPTPPVIESASVAANSHNVLSAIMSVRVRGADSVAIRYSLTDAPSGIDSVTPAVLAEHESVIVPVFGLLPARDYSLRVMAYAGGAWSERELPFTTGALPADLPRYTTSSTDPTPGFIVFAAGAFGLVIDNTGRVVWYRRFANGAGLNFIAQPNGRYTARPPTSDPADVGLWDEIDPLGNVTRALGCVGALRPRLHDLVAEENGDYWLLCDETRTMDLSALGGVAGALVTGTVVQHISAGGALLFEWSPFDHFSITDMDVSARSGATVNWTHGNAIDFDDAGNLLVSFRNLGEVAKIDARNGDVLWRLGGRRNEFAFIGAPTPSFIGQHSARASAPGALLLLDNIGDPAQSRVERYDIDENARTARLVQSYGSTPAVSTLIGGSVQSLPVGRTLVSFGTAGRVEEYDANGQVVWRIEGHAGYVFRAQKIRSLYAPGVDPLR
jgi:hypothetical protein